MTTISSVYYDDLMKNINPCVTDSSYDEKQMKNAPEYC